MDPDRLGVGEPTHGTERDGNEQAGGRAGRRADARRRLHRCIEHRRAARRQVRARHEARQRFAITGPQAIDQAERRAIGDAARRGRLIHPGTVDDVSETRLQDRDIELRRRRCRRCRGEGRVLDAGKGEPQRPLTLRFQAQVERTCAGDRPGPHQVGESGGRAAVAPTKRRRRQFDHRSRRQHRRPVDPMLVKPPVTRIDSDRHDPVARRHRRAG